MVLVYTGVAAGAGYIYLRIFRGWRLTDLMYVTRSSLSKSLSSVTSGRHSCPPHMCKELTGNLEGFLRPIISAGVEGLSQRLANMRSFVQQQITTLTAKQVCQLDVRTVVS